MNEKKFIVGNWYKSKHNNYFKFEKTENDWNYYSEKIINNIWKREEGAKGWSSGVGMVVLWVLEDLTEIQPFLPANHPDLFINKPIQNENLDYLIDLLKSNNIT